ncbi:FecR family protein [Hyalangium gracile]|uniref:FecR family protein n=1 Tax=Hyalangium gracile TaxID=394092 RepID=UPI001CCD881E|nr:FecR family protein [Hyalangium gracile]
MYRPLLWLTCLFALPALAEVGRVAQLEGEATRTASGGAVEALEEGSAIEVGDVLAVKDGGNLALLLTDESTLVLAGGSQLRIDEATFAGLERKGFSARLLVGTVWARVKKAVAGSSAKFDVTTERAVAGVRGTTFQVEVAGEETRVDVEEGLVEVQHDGSAPGQARPEARQVHQVRGGERVRFLRERALRERFVGPQGRFHRFVRAAHERVEKLRHLPLERRFQERRQEQRERLRERRNRR